MALSVFALNSCSDDDDNTSSTTSTIVKIKVTKAGKVASGVTVCLFDSDSGPGTPFFTPFSAKKKVVTESNGIASFNLQEVYDLNVIDKQTTFYFGVFEGKDTDPVVLGKTAVTIKKGDTKEGSINF